MKENEKLIASADDIKRIIDLTASESIKVIESPTDYPVQVMSSEPSGEIEEAEIDETSIAKSKPRFSNKGSATSDDVEIETDKNYAIGNLKDTSDILTDSLDKLATIAEDSQHPRAFEVMATLAKSITEIQKNIMEIHKDKKKLSEAPAWGQGWSPDDANLNKTVNNNTIVFAGTNDELDKIMTKMIESNKPSKE